MTQKFEYTDTDGIKKEAEAYVTTDFVFLSAPNSPVVTGPDGRLSPTVLPLTGVGKSASLVILRKASENMLRGDIVRASTANHVAIADPTTDRQSAAALGMVLGDAAMETDVEVLLIGTILDPIFSIFSSDDILFLDEQGSVTNVRPSKPTKNYLTVVGKALGGNEILVQIETPKTLGA